MSGFTGPVVVVGGGLAALSFAGTLRQGGYAGPLTVVSEEQEAPYDRPPLSKAFQLDGDLQKIRLDTARLQPGDLLTGLRVDSIDLPGRTLRLADGRSLPWVTLVLATGASPRTLPALAAAGRPVCTLRTVDDARRIRALLQPGRRMLLVGAGVIGLELAATASQLGAEVVVVEAQPRVMARSVSPALSGWFERRHAAAGVELRLGRTVRACADGVVELDDGARIPFDVAVAGIGVTANDALARAAGIRCDDGIFVDGHGRTSATGVLAVGDVTRQVEPVSGRVMRIETWANAQNQAAAAARALLDPAAPPYQDPAWFWSDQYELRLQGVGLAAGPREVRRGDFDAGRFTLLHFDGARLVGAACMNNARDFGALRKLVGREFQAGDDAWAQAADLRKLA